MACDHTAGSYCLFSADNMWFAISAMQIREVTTRTSWARVPHSNSVLAGLYHAGSEFLPVLRLPSARPQSTGPPHREEHMLILEGPNGPWGFAVDHIVGIERLDCAHDGDGYQDDWSTAVMGTTTWNNDIVRVLNPDGLYRLAEAILKRDWQAAV